MEKAVRIIALLYLIFSLAYIISSVGVLIIVHNFGINIFDENTRLYNSYESNFLQRLILENPFGLYYNYGRIDNYTYLKDIYHEILLYFFIGILICSILILFEIPAADYLFLFILSIRLPFSASFNYLIFRNLFYRLKTNFIMSTYFIDLLFFILDITVIIFLLIYLTVKSFKFPGFTLNKILQFDLKNNKLKNLVNISSKIIIRVLFFMIFISMIFSSFYLYKKTDFMHHIRLNITHYILLNTNPPKKRVMHKLEQDPFILEIDYDKFMESFKNDYCKNKKVIKPGEVDLNLYFIIKDYYSNLSCINLDLILKNEKITNKDSRYYFDDFLCELALKENAVIYDMVNKKYLKYLKLHIVFDGQGGFSYYTHGKRFIISEWSGT